MDSCQFSEKEVLKNNISNVYGIDTKYNTEIQKIISGDDRRDERRTPNRDVIMMVKAITKVI